MQTDFRIIAHVIGFESRDTLAGRARKLAQAEVRAKQAVQSMTDEGKQGYVIIRDHITRKVAQTHFVTGQQEPDDDENKDHWNDEGDARLNTETDRAEIGTSRAGDVHRTVTG